MNAVAWPTLPATTTSAPFSEIAQRAAASPRTTSSPPWAVAAADWPAFAPTSTRPLIMFSAMPTPQVPLMRTVACWLQPAQ